MIRLIAILATVAGGSSAAANAEPEAYVPQAVYCADGSAALCPVLPSFIGADPALDSGLGYAGLSNNVHSAAQDVQSPFDNMAWQMFVALNWQAGAAGAEPAAGLAGDGPTVWQGWKRPEDVFGGATASCENPNGLPRFDLIAKSAAQGSPDEEFLQATGQPLIDINGNWALFERRLNDVEVAYIVDNRLDSRAGQQAFVARGGAVELPLSDASRTDGAPGAIEIKASWRIVGDAEKSRYFHIDALLDVEGAFVSDGAPLCKQVTLGLTGLHIIQNTPALHNLRQQFVWASFEHEDNAPLAEKACDAADPNCYKTIAENACPAAADAGRFAFHDSDCGAAITNVPPPAPPKGQAYQWQRSPPYAGSYMTEQNGKRCGTQAVRCWDVYSLTQVLNGQWRARLAAADSVFAHYFLIGTNWGGNVEPDGTQLANGSVPAFLGNSTMETYIQANPEVGNCVNCHANASLAYHAPDHDGMKGLRYPADFSFLLGLATRTCADLDAGPIWNDGAAGGVCPGVCDEAELAWNGQWTTTEPGLQSVCGCCIKPVAAASQES